MILYRIGCSEQAQYLMMYSIKGKSYTVNIETKWDFHLSTTFYASNILFHAFAFTYQLFNHSVCHSLNATLLAMLLLFSIYVSLIAVNNMNGFKLQSCLLRRCRRREREKALDSIIYAISFQYVLYHFLLIYSRLFGICVSFVRSSFFDRKLSKSFSLLMYKNAKRCK